MQRWTNKMWADRPLQLVNYAQAVVEEHSTPCFTVESVNIVQLLSMHR